MDKKLLNLYMTDVEKLKKVNKYTTFKPLQEQYRKIIKLWFIFLVPKNTKIDRLYISRKHILA